MYSINRCVWLQNIAKKIVSLCSVTLCNVTIKPPSHPGFANIYPLGNQKVMSKILPVFILWKSHGNFVQYRKGHLLLLLHKDVFTNPLNIDELYKEQNGIQRNIFHPYLYPDNTCQYRYLATDAKKT